MQAKTHHVIVFQPKDTLCLAGAHLKQKKHPKARILQPSDIKKGSPIFRSHDPTPWKLHIFQHGSTGMSEFGPGNKPVSLPDVAQTILDSGLAGQPNQSTDYMSLPIVRLDVCSAAVTSPGVTSTLEQLASALTDKLKAGKIKSKVVLWGGKGIVIAPWDEKRGGRIIGKSSKATELFAKWDEAQAAFKKSHGIEFERKLAKNPADYLKQKAREKTVSKLQSEALKKKARQVEEIWKKKVVGQELESRAKIAWLIYDEAMQKFHELVAAESSLSVKKTNKQWKFLDKDSVIGGDVHRLRRENYLARAEATWP
jgi:hypothetical protein